MGKWHKYEAGQKFNRLTLVSPDDPARNGGNWLCRCDCGREKIVFVYDVRRGSVQSCGVCIFIGGDWSGKRTAEEIGAIRSSDESERNLAKRYGCSETAIRKIRARKLYRHV